MTSQRGWLGETLATGYDRAAYVRSAADGSGAGLVRLAVLSLLLGGGWGARGAWEVWRAVGVVDLSGVPELHLEGGVLSSPVDQPYRFETDAGTVVVDTTGQLTDADRQGAVVVLERHTYTLTRPGSPPHTRTLSSLPDVQVDATTVRPYLLRLLGLGLALVVAGRLVGAVVLALIGGELVRRRADGRYGDGLRLAVLALTPVVLLDLLQRLTGLDVPAWNLVAIGLWAAYGEWAARSLAEVSALSSRRSGRDAA